MKNQTIQLQSVGHVPAIPASEVREGDVRMYNFGSTGLVIKVIEKTSKTLTLITFESGKYFMFDIRKTSLVAIVKSNQDVSTHQPKEAHCKREIVDVSEYFQTESEEEKLEKYHLQLQEKGMTLSATKPEVNENSTYRVIVSIDRDTNQVGEFEKVLTGKELDFQLFMNEVLEIIEEITQNEIITTEQANSINETVEESQSVEPSGITYKLNEEKNGVEIYFDSIPSEEIRNMLKANGFRWAKYNKCWYVKQSEETLSLAKKLAGEGAANNNDSITEPTQESQGNSIARGSQSFYTYPEIEIDDCTDEKYNIHQSLQDREHDSVWIFRQNKKDHNKGLQELFINYTDKVKSVISTTNNQYYIYKLKSSLQRFKKNYHQAYIKYLTHKANNPSWAVTGRGGMNISKYNKAMNRQDSIMMDVANLPKEFETELNKYNNKIRRDNEETLNNQLQEELKQPLPESTFKTVTKDFDLYGRGLTVKTRFYECEGYSIAKLWGAFRVFETATGKEVYSTKSAGTLQDAKAYVQLLIKKDRELQAV